MHSHKKEKVLCTFIGDYTVHPSDLTAQAQLKFEILANTHKAMEFNDQQQHKTKNFQFLRESHDIRTGQLQNNIQTLHKTRTH